MNTRIWIAAGLLTWVSLSVAAQGDGQPDPQQRREQVKQALDLSDEQADQLHQIMANARAERDVIRENAAGDRAAARPELEALRDRTQAQVSGVLTAEQMTRFETLREQRMARHRKAQRHQGSGQGR